ncbi:hypothetical protein LAWI1_G008776 [Lachnellula willkommii]|uniref:DUF4185 domain-containing protein n=1 Tax=Lachnellula willkommii TaxID=215461 RepID=A0A559M2I2_9HELO|nr:hypothetical protein LAWI1_G008776 [Lachnellula willkommii]
MRKAFSKLADKIDGPKNRNGGSPSSSSQAPLINHNTKPSRKAIYPQPGLREPGPGQLPPKVASAKNHGIMHFFLPNGREHIVCRDVGNSGVLDGKVIWGWGDTLMGAGGRGSKANICATDSTSIGDMSNPMYATDTALWDNNDYVANFIPCLPSEEKDGGLVCYAFGGSNVIEYAPNEGLLFFLKIHRPDGKNHIKGAGVAKVTMEGNVPKCHRDMDTLWTKEEPCYGDVGIAYDRRDGFLYAFGKGPQQDDEQLIRRTYLCRAPLTQAFNINAYQYWDNSAKAWTPRRLTTHGNMGTLKLTYEQAIFDYLQMDRSAPFWSNYFNKWMFLYGNSWGYSDVYVMTADRLEGPWDTHGGMVVASTGGEPVAGEFRYAVNGHPEWDESGKTVFVTWTKLNEIYGTTITWE